MKPGRQLHWKKLSFEGVWEFVQVPWFMHGFEVHSSRSVSQSCLDGSLEIAPGSHWQMGSWNEKFYEMKIFKIW